MSAVPDNMLSLQMHLSKPSPARIYAYMLNPATPNSYEIDRTFADQQLLAMPDIRRAMRENRRFVGRVVRAALDAGVSQFVDIGSGLPSEGQVHEVADTHAPDAAARVVYVDNELIAHAHSELLLTESADATRHRAVLGDFFNHGDLLRRVGETGVIDFEQPVCLLVTAILHFMVPGDRPEVPMEVYRNALAPGSMLAITHVGDQRSDEGLQTVARNYTRSSTNPAHLRDDEEIETFFAGWPLLEPGMCWAGEWRPPADRSAEPWWDDDCRSTEAPEGTPWWGEHPARMYYRAAVGVKP